MLGTRTITVVAALLWLAVFGVARAQEPLFNRVVQSNWLHCGIVAGRVTVDGTRLGNMRSTTKSGQRSETINIRNENGQFSLSYQRTTANDELTAEVSSPGDRVLLRRMPRGKSAVVPMEFVQAPNEKIALKLGLGPEQQAFRTQSVWQLLIAQPKLCREHLLPILELARPNWKLADTVAAVEAKLLREAGENEVSRGNARWAALVAQLTDDSFAKREAADRALRMGNAGALCYLRQLDVNRLDAEQQFRIHRIIEALGGQSTDDSIDQIAASLAADPTVWLALLARPEPATRQTAARQLAALLGGTIAVDPTADPETQKDQRERLRARIEGK